MNTNSFPLPFKVLVLALLVFMGSLVWCRLSSGDEIRQPEKWTVKQKNSVELSSRPVLPNPFVAAPAAVKENVKAIDWTTMARQIIALKKVVFN